MDEQFFKKLVSRVLRHSGFTTRKNKHTGQFELYDGGPEPILYCQPVLEKEGESNEYYLCFTISTKLSENSQKLYDRMIKRFTRLGPSINISLENLLDPAFTDEQLEQLEELVNEKGADDETD